MELIAAAAETALDRAKEAFRLAAAGQPTVYCKHCDADTVETFDHTCVWCGERLT